MELSSVWTQPIRGSQVSNAEENMRKQTDEVEKNLQQYGSLCEVFSHKVWVSSDFDSRRAVFWNFFQKSALCFDVYDLDNRRGTYTTAVRFLELEPELYNRS